MPLNFIPVLSGLPVPVSWYAACANMANRLKGRHLTIKPLPQSHFIHIRDREAELYICRRSRIWLYKKSIRGRLEKLARTYNLHKIDDEKLTGAFIDCGANIGELGHYARLKGYDYHAFEPEDREAACCDLNNFGGRPLTNRVALWSKDTTLVFYSKPDSADGSLFEMQESQSRREVKAVSLDTYIKDKGITRIAVIKLEAEGAEPEILQGAKAALKIAQYITVDCGFERGLHQESTLIDVINILTASGFKAVDWNHGRVTMLFRNMHHG